MLFPSVFPVRHPSISLQAFIHFSRFFFYPTLHYALSNFLPIQHVFPPFISFSLSPLPSPLSNLLHSTLSISFACPLPTQSFTSYPLFLCVSASFFIQCSSSYPIHLFCAVTIRSFPSLSLLYISHSTLYLPLFILPYFLHPQ